MAQLLDRLSRNPRSLAPILGVLVACGFEPLKLWPLALLALALLIELIARAPSARRAALIGWLFGLGLFTLGNNWIATAFTYQAAMPAWLGWVAVAGLAAFLAIYPALAALGAWLIGRRSYGALVMAMAGTWIITEWLRSWVFTGFAWNPLAAIALGGFDHAGLAGLAPWLGTYALSGLVVMLAGAWLIAVRRGLPDWRGAVLVLVPAVLFLSPLRSAPLDETGGKGLTITLVQPDIDQTVLNDPAMFEANFTKLATLSPPRQSGQRRLLLWPESGVPDYLREGYPDRYYLDNYGADPVLARRRLGKVAGAGGMLLSGTSDLEIGMVAGRERAVGARNSVTALDESGTIRGSYAKAHLVPGGEYLPLRALLTPLGLARLVPGDIDFWPGPGPRTLDLGPWGRAGVQVCYEIIFSGQVVDRANRPQFLFNPSNDGWFGAWGPPQHLAQARLRAIEEGLPVLRSTTTGISAVIDARGRVLDHLPQHHAGRIDTALPAPLAPTLFARLGNMLGLGWAAVLLALSAVASRRHGS
ncbi:apolipoprotein N-acyltransferase [Novosphingobium sp.]|uniref:apolipoprotein N-acyltransferase n=1 Tax=Novosphingobium sp. TaxID=1874826 RepID=UPI001ECBDF3A|nr:apolipoprotein N-acyltransferase [Novosphingobium sp.]MBK9010871.1 apolipoprotein N-acyltransferase [Novosphingobium sp.]